MFDLFFVVAWIISGIGTLLLGAVAVTYIRRTWQLIRAEEDDPTRERLLDGLDHLENQMHLVGGRLADLEKTLEGIDGRLDTAGSPPKLPHGRGEGAGHDHDQEPEHAPEHDHEPGQ